MDSYSNDFGALWRVFILRGEFDVAVRERVSYRAKRLANVEGCASGAESTPISIQNRSICREQFAAKTRSRLRTLNTQKRGGKDDRERSPSPRSSIKAISRRTPPQIATARLRCRRGFLEDARSRRGAWRGGPCRTQQGSKSDRRTFTGVFGEC